MTPEEKKQFDEMKSQLDQVVSFINSLESVATIPSQLESALRSRFKFITSSPKTAASATKSVNEAGSNNYTVMFAPDGFLLVTDEFGNKKNIPYIN
jgi:hypothetical protein